MYKYQKNIVYKTKNCKYSNKTLIKCIINILKDGISFRSISKYKKIY